MGRWCQFVGLIILWLGQASYEPPNLPAFDPNATYSTPEYYAPTGIKLYPIYPPNYFSTVHPFSFIAAYVLATYWFKDKLVLISFFGSNKNDPSDQEAVRQKTQEIQRIIEQAKKNPAVNWEEQRRHQEYEYQATNRKNEVKRCKEWLRRRQRSRCLPGSMTALTSIHCPNPPCTLFLRASGTIRANLTKPRSIFFRR